MPSGILNWFLIAVVAAIGFAVGQRVNSRIGL